MSFKRTMKIQASAIAFRDRGIGISAPDVQSAIEANRRFMIESAAVTPEEKAAMQGSYGTPGEDNRYVTNSDPRMTNARTPTTHANTHKSDGSDPISPEDIGAETPAGAQAKADAALASALQAIVNAIDTYVFGLQAEPSPTWRATWTGNVSADKIWLFLPVPGKYRVQVIANAGEVWSENVTDGGAYITLGGHLFLESSRSGAKLSTEAYVSESSPTTLSFDLTSPAAGWVHLGVAPETREVEHWEDPSEIEDEHLTGKVEVTQVQLGFNVSRKPISGFESLTEIQISHPVAFQTSSPEE